MIKTFFKVMIFFVTFGPSSLCAAHNQRGFFGTVLNPEYLEPIVDDADQGRGSPIRDVKSPADKIPNVPGKYRKLRELRKEHPHDYDLKGRLKK